MVPLCRSRISAPIPGLERSILDAAAAMMSSLCDSSTIFSKNELLVARLTYSSCCSVVKFMNPELSLPVDTMHRISFSAFWTSCGFDDDSWVRSDSTLTQPAKATVNAAANIIFSFFIAYLFSFPFCLCPVIVTSQAHRTKRFCRYFRNWVKVITSIRHRLSHLRQAMNSAHFQMRSDEFPRHLILRQPTDGAI